MGVMEELGDRGKAFLVEMMHRCEGDASRQLDTGEIGAALGLDRDDARKVAEELIGWQLVEVRTLAGGIGLSEEGAALAQRLDPDAPGTSAGDVTLGDGPIAGGEGIDELERTIAALKHALPRMNLSYERIAEIVADVRTLEAQLGSPRPKNSILRACCRSLADMLERDNAELADGFARL